MPGSIVNTVPASSVSSFAPLIDGNSCTEIPKPWPKRCVKYSPYPASVITSRAILSNSLAFTPAFTAAMAASFAALTVS